jgi:hypothetical protein
MIIKSEALVGKTIKEFQVHYKAGDQIDGLGFVFTDGSTLFLAPKFTDISEGQIDYPFIFAMALGMS